MKCVVAFLYTPWHEALLYTQALSVTHACIRTREITSVVYGRNAENEPVSPIKMADYSAVVSMGTL